MSAACSHTMVSVTYPSFSTRVYFSCDRCPPRQFLPALSKIFLDEAAPIMCLEASMRAVTFYLGASFDS